MITGAPGAGKSSVAEALTTLLDNAGIEHGAIESEQLAWGTPWLDEALAYEQLPVVLRMQRGYGRRMFVVVATTETQGGPGRPAARDRRRALVRGGAGDPGSPGVDLVLSTDGRDEASVAAELLAALDL